MIDRPALLVTRTLLSNVIPALRARCDVDVFEGEGSMSREALLARIAGRPGAITMLTDRIDSAILDAAGPHLRVVADHAVGVDNTDVDECTRPDVMVTTTPDVLIETTADLSWALLLAAARRIAEGDRFLRGRSSWVWGPG